MDTSPAAAPDPNPNATAYATVVVQPNDPATWPALLRMADLCSTPEFRGILPISKVSLWRLIRDGVMPQPMRFGGVPIWRRHDIEAAIDRLNAEARTLQVERANKREQRSARRPAAKPQRRRR